MFSNGRRVLDELSHIGIKAVAFVHICFKSRRKSPIIKGYEPKASRAS